MTKVAWNKTKKSGQKLYETRQKEVHLTVCFIHEKADFFSFKHPYQSIIKHALKITISFLYLQSTSYLITQKKNLSSGNNNQNCSGWLLYEAIQQQMKLPAERLLWRWINKEPTSSLSQRAGWRGSHAWSVSWQCGRPAAAGCRRWTTGWRCPSLCRGWLWTPPVTKNKGCPRFWHLFISCHCLCFLTCCSNSTCSFTCSFCVTCSFFLAVLVAHSFLHAHFVFLAHSFLTTDPILLLHSSLTTDPILLAHSLLTADPILLVHSLLHAHSVLLAHSFLAAVPIPLAHSSLQCLLCITCSLLIIMLALRYLLTPHYNACSALLAHSSLQCLLCVTCSLLTIMLALRYLLILLLLTRASLPAPFSRLAHHPLVLPHSWLLHHFWLLAHSWLCTHSLFPAHSELLARSLLLAHFCPKVTLRSWWDVKIQEQTNSLILYYSFVFAASFRMLCSHRNHTAY